MKGIAILCVLILLILGSATLVTGCPQGDTTPEASPEKYQGGSGDGFSMDSSGETGLDGN